LRRAAKPMAASPANSSAYVCGSGTAAVLLPADAENRILSRQLLYTGLSRAKQYIELWGTEAALLAAVANPVRRSGGLADRLT